MFNRFKRNTFLPKSDSLDSKELQGPRKVAPGIYVESVPYSPLSKEDVVIHTERVGSSLGVPSFGRSLIERYTKPQEQPFNTSSRFFPPNDRREG